MCCGRVTTGNVPIPCRVDWSVTQQIPLGHGTKVPMTQGPNVTNFAYHSRSNCKLLITNGRNAIESGT